MKLLHFADLHLDAPFAWAPPSAASKRRQALREAMARIVERARERSVDAVTCAGDLFEQERVTPDTVVSLVRAFAELAPIPVYLAPGNHDYCGFDSIYRRAGWSPNVHVFKTARLEPVTITDGITLWGAGHEVPANTADLLTGFRVNRGGVNLALFHGSERGQFVALGGEGKKPHAPFDAIEIARSGLTHALLGHYHRPAKADFYTYPGNPEPLTFGEEGLRGAVEVTLHEDGHLEREWIRVAGKDGLADVTVDLSECHSSQDCIARVRECLRDQVGAVRLRLVGELPPEAELDTRLLEPAAPHLDALVVRTEVRPAYDLESIKQERTVRGQFVRDVLDDEELDAERRQLVLTAGLRALDGRADLEVC